ncbi:MAG TPA: TOBE domain-containing protein, partial [Casimicrobiaceae bacterium]|nr:TOBE domain-containing protein [Casimicrobiaceae bacterium]
HDLRLSPCDSIGNVLGGVVKSVQWQGDMQNVELDVAGHALRLTCAPMHAPPAPGAPLAIHFSASEATLIPEHTLRG